MRLTSSDGVGLFVSDEGPRSAPAILFAHEFGGDWRTWDGLVAALSGTFRCLRYAARGFDPSDTPQDPGFYGQERATADIAEIADRLGLEDFHLVGCSMGSFTSLCYALGAARRLASLTLIGCSSGPRNQEESERYHRDLDQEIALLVRFGAKGAADWLAADPAYRRMATKQPDQWQAYLARLRGQPVAGARQILQTVHRDRRSLFAMKAALRRLETPSFLIYGEEDHPLVGPTNRFLGETLPAARRFPVPATGHLVHLEEPERMLDILQSEILRSGAVPGLS